MPDLIQHPRGKENPFYSPPDHIREAGAGSFAKGRNWIPAPVSQYGTGFAGMECMDRSVLKRLPILV
jgi:hypothetical protein